MEKSEFYKQLAYRMDTPVDKAKKFVNIFEEMILEIIALEDNVRFDFGEIGGETRKPKRACGYYKNTCGGDWTFAKYGYPYIKWSKKALDCEKENGTEYLKKMGLLEQYEKKYQTSDLKAYEKLKTTISKESFQSNPRFERRYEIAKNSMKKEKPCE